MSWHWVEKKQMDRR